MLLVKFDGIRGTIPMGVVSALGLPVAMQNSLLSRTIPRWPVWTPHRVAGIVERVCPTCLCSFSNVTFVGAHSILSSCAILMSARTDFGTAALLWTLLLVAIMALMVSLSGH